MIPKTLDEVFAANAAIRDKFKTFTGSIATGKTTVRPPDGGWSIAEIVEHTAIVFEGVVKICNRLAHAAAAEGTPAPKELPVSEAFLNGAKAAENARLEAPEIVQPTGLLSITEAHARMDAAASGLAPIRELLENYDASRQTFPHPAFGDLNAYEWLVLAGGHEMRHLRQIQRTLESLD